ncbi:MAG: hypothetical protein KBA02_07835 [Paludibacteraceae bacterium]|nr:hypothetical protein [Paludibacteraceae bacterium]
MDLLVIIATALGCKVEDFLEPIKDKGDVKI